MLRKVKEHPAYANFIKGAKFMVGVFLFVASGVSALFLIFIVPGEIGFRTHWTIGWSLFFLFATIAGGLIQAFLKDVAN